MTRNRRVAMLPSGATPPAWDWSDRQHWGGGRRRPCRVCGRPSFLLDHAGLPAHKTCVDVT